MNLNVVYVSNNVKLPKKELMKEALKEPVIIKKNTRFSAKPYMGAIFSITKTYLGSIK